ncbi:MAG TPA: hypothetical protein VLS93_01820 [Anaeromyxobacteraceae bacterium]|nr:hypothetical protein [Anaeromyxobacteraceae bacterium]
MSGASTAGLPGRSTWAALALAGCLAAAWAAGAWKAWRDPGTAWLGGGPGRWIVYPSPADTKVRRLVEMAATFRRDFPLPARPASAELRLRAFHRAEAFVNGRPVPLEPAEGDWKRPRRAEVAELLVAGPNRIEVVVANVGGPPALALELRTPGGVLASGGEWEASLAGAAWRGAALARDPPGGRRYDAVGASLPAWDGIRERWPTLLGLAALSAAAAGLAGWALRRWPGALASPRAPAVAVAAVGLLWAALFANDATDALPLPSGFDGSEHLAYVRHVLERRAIPLADEGWQMFQPPLYYLLAAGALGAAGLDTASPSAVVVLRALGLAIGLANVACVALLLRRLFPSRPAPQAAGLLAAGFLPPMLTLHQFPTNEILVAALSSAALLVTVGILQGDRTTMRGHVLLGVLLGLALLAKFSALLLLAAVLGVLGLRALPGPARELPRRLVPAGAAALAAVAVSGWHFARVWARFGDPFVGGWEARPGLGWWLDPGYRTADHFLRFGRVFSDPLFSGLGGFWDGLYSTLWGDGLLSGLAAAALPPWWDPPLHAAGYALALLPTALALLGFGVTVRAWVRRPAAVEGLLLALALLVLAALCLMALRVPSVAQDKAFYGLLALGPLAFFAARGVAALAGGRAAPALLLVAGLGAWAATSYATFWIDRRSTEARLTGGVMRVASGDVPGGVAALRAAVAGAPDDWRARVALARVLLDTAGPTPEVEALLQPGAPGPDLAGRHLAVTIWAQARGDAATGLGAAERAVSLDPDGADGLGIRAELLEASGRPDLATLAWREFLRVEPQEAHAHAALARILAADGREGEAAFHRGYAARLGR